MKPIIFSLDPKHPLKEPLAEKLSAEIGRFNLRDFPDGETYLRVESAVEGREVVVLASLDYPNPKFLPLIFLSENLKEMGAKRVGLLSPYLSYMRQDKRFNPGEAVTSRYFAKSISSAFDWLITVDPHLHRYHDLSEIYNIPTKAVKAAPLISQWIKEHVAKALLIGPDSESKQWVAKIAERAKAPYVVLQKTRRGDREVQITLPKISQWQDHQPVLADDIISTGYTMIESIRHLKEANFKDPVCIGIHGLFAEGAYEGLIQAGVSQVVTCNSIRHVSNAIDLSEILAASMALI